MSRGRLAVNLALALVCLALIIRLGLGFADWPWWGEVSASARGQKAGGPASSASLPAPSASDPFSGAGRPQSLPVRSADTGVTVLGVVLTPEDSFALVKGGDGTARRLRVGDTMGGYKVSRLEAGRMALAPVGGGQEREIRWRTHDRYLQEPDQERQARPKPAHPGIFVGQPGQPADRRNQ